MTTETSDPGWDQLPATLTGDAATEWERLATSGLPFREADREAWGAYCTAVADLRAASKRLRGDGATLPERATLNAALKARTDASTRLRRLAHQLGMTPTGRFQQQTKQRAEQKRMEQKK